MIRIWKNIIFLLYYVYICITHTFYYIYVCLLFKIFYYHLHQICCITVNNDAFFLTFYIRKERGLSSVKTPVKGLQMTPTPLLEFSIQRIHLTLINSIYDSYHTPHCNMSCFECHECIERAFQWKQLNLIKYIYLIFAMTYIIIINIININVKFV